MRRKLLESLRRNKRRGNDSEVFRVRKARDSMLPCRGWSWVNTFPIEHRRQTSGTWVVEECVKCRLCGRAYAARVLRLLMTLLASHMVASVRLSVTS